MKHQLDGQELNWSKYLISDTVKEKKKVKSQTFRYLATEYGSLKSIADFSW